MKITINLKSNNLSITEALDIVRIYNLTGAREIKFKGFNYVTQSSVTIDREIIFNIKEENS